MTSSSLSLSHARPKISWRWRWARWIRTPRGAAGTPFTVPAATAPRPPPHPALRTLYTHTVSYLSGYTLSGATLRAVWLKGTICDPNRKLRRLTRGARTLVSVWLNLSAVLFMKLGSCDPSVVSAVYQFLLCRCVTGVPLLSGSLLCSFSSVVCFLG